MKNLDISRLIFGEGRDAELEKYVENVFKKFDNDNSGKLSFQEWAWHFFSIDVINETKSSKNLQLIVINIESHPPEKVEISYIV